MGSIKEPKISEWGSHLVHLIDYLGRMDKIDPTSYNAHCIMMAISQFANKINDPIVQKLLEDASERLWVMGMMEHNRLEREKIGITQFNCKRDAKAFRSLKRREAKANSNLFWNGQIYVTGVKHPKYIVCHKSDPVLQQYPNFYEAE